MRWIFKNKNLPSENQWEKDFVKNKINSQGKKVKAFLVALFFVFNFAFATFPTVTSAATTTPSTGTTTQVNQNTQNTEKAEADNGFFMTAIKKLLIFVFNGTAWLSAVAATIFEWVVNPINISGTNGVLNKQAVKDVWIMVRDLLNMTFILVLLFAAFCTIFQVSNWNLKKVWFNILLNALLVNFSFPIARFFIDVSNVAFYYLVNNLFSSTGTVTGSSIFAMLGAESNLSKLLAPENYSHYDVTYLIAMIVISFIFGMTLLVIAGLFMVRLMVLALLVMFSPIGFVGYILPSTAKYASKWWDALFSYSFFAPIMMFGIAVSLRITEAIGKGNMQSFKAGAIANSPAAQSAWIADAAFYVIPIILLWTTMGYAKSSGIALAGEVTGRVKGLGKWIANGAYWTAFKNPIARGVKEGVKERTPYNRVVKWWKDPSNLEAAVKGSISNAHKEGKGGFRAEWKNAWNKSAGKTISDANKKKIAENVQDHIDSGKTAEALIGELNSHAQKKDDFIKQASAAQAYLRMDSFERKNHFDKAITYNATAGDYGEFNHILTAGPHPHITDAAEQQAFIAERDAAKTAADALKANPNDKHARNTLSTFVTRQLRANVTRGTKAK